MARAGVQKMSLPDIYKMFKTASNEDKIKLMNTYSNLGERFGEYDKDIDYRRRDGDPEALNEKMYTEGIGDVLGSAWDYTKQGAETAWDYAKKGAKKGAESLRDLVMRDVAVNDLVRGDEVIGEEQEEQQVPTNDTPLPWKVRSGEFVGSKENAVDDDWENTDLGTDEQLPWEVEGNAFVGSKEDADIDPLAGGVSRDPNISLFDAVNEPALEEEEVLTPQEQRFLGESAPKKEVVESPMARRARERLEKLTAEQEYYANNPDARWSDLYKIDAERATFDYNREKTQQKTELDMLKALGTDSNLDDIRAIHNAYINQKTALYNQGFDDTDPRVKIADSYIKYTGDLLAEKGLLPKSSEVNAGSVNDTTYESDTTKLNSAINDGRKAIRSAVDKDGDGVVDNAQDIIEKLNNVLREYNINPNSKEWKATLGEWDFMVANIGKQATEATNRKERIRQQKSQQFSQYKDFYPSYKSVVSIQKDPHNATNVQLGVSELLKILSGTGVSDKERASTILALTPTAYQEQMRSKATSIGKSLIDVVLNMDQVALAEYSKNVDPVALAKQLSDRIPPEAWNWAEKESGEDDGIKITRRKKK